ncbi:ParB/Srx family N-terminal domain-containing protein [Neisseria canis]|uniref:ParB/Sulfiredoxin domain-containing protein n=1 Tax=Neisseria canis TaxID=493 RepID=A0A448D9M8_9NEIS|nr:ParB/Srx family N-terminal domain-containing protein [Neisseria canis]OSI12954.1 hypothetical protein BWD07_02465 [Neisseria canis]VEF02385.1 Uncharacterised protein [Neisseria canis]
MNESKYFHIDQLLLDSENPRHVFMGSQSEIIAYLIENENIKELAKDIAQKGALSPFNAGGLLSVEGEPGKYWVLEGNRRVCALKLLNNPDLAPASSKKYFERLVANAVQIPTNFFCHVFANREEAKEWLASRHGDFKGGAGLKPWSAVQSARFFEKKEHSMAVTILQFALREGIIDEDRAHRIVTTVSRMFSTPQARDTFGIVTGRSNGTVLINVELTEFAVVLAEYLADIENPELNVGSRSTKEDRIGYREILAQKGKLPKTKLDHTIDILTGTVSKIETGNVSVAKPGSRVTGNSPVSGASVDAGGKAQPESKPIRTPPARDKARKLIDYSLQIRPEKIRAVFLELKNKLDVQETPYSAAALLRILIELSCDHYILNHAETIVFNDGGKSFGVNEKSPLRIKILGIAHHIHQSNSNLIDAKQFAALQNECPEAKTNAGGLNLLHNIMHNYSHSITAVHVIAAHDNFKPFIQALWHN